jgi:hypothetical protein
MCVYGTPWGPQLTTSESKHIGGCVSANHERWRGGEYIDYLDPCVRTAAAVATMSHPVIHHSPMRRFLTPPYRTSCLLSRGGLALGLATRQTAGQLLRVLPDSKMGRGRCGPRSGVAKDFP